MRRRHALASVVMIAACGAPSSPRPVSNLTPDTPAVAEVAVDAAGPLGVLALPASAARDDGTPFWVALSPTAAAVVPTYEGTPVSLTVGTRYRAISAGAAVELTAGEKTTIGYGCDQTSLDVIPLAGAGAAAGKPGLYWVLPAPMPSEWSPEALPITVVKATREERQVRAGDVTITTRRKDKTHAHVTITVGGRAVHDEDAEAYFMQGAEPIDIDLTQGHAPGVPTPEAVFAFAKTGPYLVTFDRSGYEGVAFETMFVSHDGRARAIESLGLGAYYCAF